MAVTVRNYLLNLTDGHGVQINWYADFYFPFLRRWEAVVRAVAGPNKPLWVEPIPNEVSAGMTYCIICVLT